MGRISLIAIIDEQNGLGFQNQLLCHLPADLQHFKQLTLGKPVIMGRKTFDSLGKPLPGRTNIVISRSVTHIEGVILVDSLSKAIQLYQEAEELMIIGGAELFSQALVLASRLYITQIHHQFEADVFFPRIDPALWICREQRFRESDLKNKYDLTFYQYDRK